MLVSYLWSRVHFGFVRRRLVVLLLQQSRQRQLPGIGRGQQVPIGAYLRHTRTELFPVPLVSRNVSPVNQAVTRMRVHAKPVRHRPAFASSSVIGGSVFHFR